MGKVVKIVVIIAAIAIAVGLLGYAGVFSNILGSTKGSAQPTVEDTSVASGGNNTTLPPLIIEEVLEEDLDTSILEDIDELPDNEDLEDLEDIEDLEDLEDIEDLNLP